ncbi:MAG: DUF4290 domain-containing protein [Prevotella sp.]|jgi:hypothetical protein|nr:DUF4290 domain-containing protein [Prevotella sp.]MBQ5495461.1 DUF4290 domain-containing protein [Prevotella sp.]
MDIKGLDYNTQREKLVMPEYGREIQKMVDLAVGLPTKEERNQCAQAIIHQMESKNPQLRTTPDYEQTLWDHLYLMSHKQLDIDWPYDVNDAENILSKPQPMAHPVHDEQAHLRHYGRLLTQVFEKLKTMEEGPERDELVRQTANQMKRDLATWGHGSVEDEKVADDLARFTDGRIQIDLQAFSFDHIANQEATDPKRKKKK